MFDVSPTAGSVVGAATEWDPEKVFRDVCNENEVHPNVVRGPRRDRQIMMVRRQCATALRETGLSLVEIGRMLNRHHATVLALIDTSP